MEIKVDNKKKTKMKTVWKIIIISIIVGIILSITGLTLGASRSLYLDKTGVHVNNKGTGIGIEINLLP